MNKLNHNTQAGKGDKPRNCFSQKYRDNYDSIDWNKKNDKNQINIDVTPSPKCGLSASR
jgi:hypothetical protein